MNGPGEDGIEQATLQCLAFLGWALDTERSLNVNHLARIADIVRIGNRAARAAQEANRERGIPNWYSLGDRLVSDAGEIVYLNRARA